MTQVESYSPRRARRAAQSGTDQPRASLRRPGPTDPPGPDEEDGDLRGRHATPLGQGFGWVVTWTIIAALIPGAGLIAAGRRRLGWFLLGLQILAGVALVGLALTGDALKRAIDIAIDPTKLLIVAGVAAGIGLIWVLLLVLTNSQLRRYATLNRAQRLFSGLLVLALITGVALPAYKLGSYALIQRSVVDKVFSATGTGTKPSTRKADPWADQPRMNMLLIGSDAGADRTGIRPDTLILASIDTKTGNTVLFSLPRNLGHARFPAGTPGAAAWPNGFWCPNASTGLNDCLINAVWQWAMTNKTGYTGKDRGLHATEDAVAGVLGLPVDGYMLLNLKGFQEFVNDIHGVKINVRERLPIGGNSEHPVATHGYIEPGKQRLNGFEALWYARSRWSTSDYDRMDRQRCVIAAVVSQADPTTVALNFPKIAKTIKGNLSTSIGKDELQAWVDLSLRVQKGKLYSLAFTDKVLPNRDYPDFSVMHTLVQKALTKSSRAGTPSASASPSPSATTGKKKLNPSSAQNVKDLC